MVEALYLGILYILTRYVCGGECIYLLYRPQLFDTYILFLALDVSLSLSVARRRCFFSSFDVRYNVYTRVHIYILYIYTEAHTVQTPVTYTVRRAVDGYCCARFSMEYRGKR